MDFLLRSAPNGPSPPSANPLPQAHTTPTSPPPLHPSIGLISFSALYMDSPLSYMSKTPSTCLETASASTTSTWWISRTKSRGSSAAPERRMMQLTRLPTPPSTIIPTPSQYIFSPSLQNFSNGSGRPIARRALYVSPSGTSMMHFIGATSGQQMLENFPMWCLLSPLTPPVFCELTWCPPWARSTHRTSSAPPQRPSRITSTPTP